MPVECVCKTCGREIRVKPSDRKRGYGKFCSRPCWHEAQRGEVREAECEQCGELFAYQLSTPRRFCSHPCYCEYQRLRARHRPTRTRAKPTVLTLLCDYCGATFTKAKSKYRGKGKAYCGSDCAAAAMAAIKLLPVSCICQVCSKAFEVRPIDARRKDPIRRGGKHCSRRCAKQSATFALSHLKKRDAKVWTNTMLRRLMEWTDEGCAFPLCATPKSKSPWNLCPLHAYRWKKSRQRRHKEQNTTLKENQ